MFTRLEASAEGARVADAMRAHPELIRGEGAPDTVVMQTLAGSVAKGGAEGLLCGVLPDGTGFAIKSADGAGRALGPAAAALPRAPRARGSSAFMSFRSQTAAARTWARSALSEALENRCGNFVTPV